MLDISGLSNYYSETSVYMILFTMSITILLSLILVFTYDKTTAPAGRSFSFIQSLMLMSVVTATIMQSIGDSLALSFGIFGALAIIRFRSNVSDLRDIAFIFATMAIGIACGVHSFQNAIIGTLTFCILIFLLKLSPFDPKHNIKGNVRLETDLNPDILSEIEKILNNHTQDINLSRFRMTTSPEGVISNEYEYSFMVVDVKSGNALKTQLQQVEGVKITRIIYEDNVYATNNY
ncbi:MAG: DUF4956 domain-containing protein [Saprospiraceae bacterium]|nr:DUF4956 domain-containing protein [Saprospiraceae bacterium]MBK8669302.1 DUF4956 domain-containing protein [Saprospiraceae bacterium]MBL0101029.1 DUF4956 domain-containing protein [Saprospiraceae bacterium]